MSRAGFAARVIAQRLDVLLGRLARGFGVLVADVGQLCGIDDHVDPFEVGQLTQLQRGERGLQRPAPTDDHDFFHTAWAQRVQRVVGDVGEREHLRIGDQNPGDVECDVAIANDDGPGTRQIGRYLLEIRMRVVPADEIDGGDTAGQLLARNVQRAIGLCADGVDHRVVMLGEFGGLDMFADHHVAEKAEPRIFGDFRELLADRFDLGVIRRDAGADQAPRRRQHLEHVDGHVDLVGGIGSFEQRCRCEEPRRSGADDGDMEWAHTPAFWSCPAATQWAEKGLASQSRAHKVVTRC